MNELVNRARVLNPDIQLGVIAYSVAEMVSIVEQADKKFDIGKITEEEYKTATNDAIEYIRSARELCVEFNLDWNVCILLSSTNFYKYVESKIN